VNKVAFLFAAERNMPDVDRSLSSVVVLWWGISW